ncbi:MAG: LysE family translocator [Burkholderiales bacterium]
MLGISDYPAFVGAVIVFLAIPGPGNLALLTATAQGGRKGGISATCGVIVGDQVLMWAAVGGLAAVLQAAPIWFLALQWAGALYLGYLGVQMIRAKPEEAPLLDMSSGRYFRQTLFITLLNPKAIVFYMAFFPLFIDPAQNPGWLTFACMSLTVAVLTFLYGAGLTLLTHRLAGNMQTHPQMGQWLQKIAGAVLLGFGLRLVLQK